MGRAEIDRVVAGLQRPAHEGQLAALVLAADDRKADRVIRQIDEEPIRRRTRG